MARRKQGTTGGPIDCAGFLPRTRSEMSALGWDRCDCILITGDAYVDHPSFGVSLIARYLENRRYRVGLIAQPNWRGPDDFTELGEPRLFFGISSGNVDSMVANYSANKKKRKKDEYSPGEKAGLRPDRAVVVYANRVREAYGSVPIVLGGLEASLRRLAHYDYWDDRVRRSILLDSRADILVYGMGEHQIGEIARRLDRGKAVSVLDGIPGTAVVRPADRLPKNALELPSCETVMERPDRYSEAFKLSYLEMDPARARPLVQAHGKRYVVQNPPALPLSSDELDHLYALPYQRTWHPSYDAAGGVPALETVRFSITSHRGCCGECSFCAIYFHQGRIVQSRSEESILGEARLVAARPDFRGTITDIGGPTANMYGMTCKRWDKNNFCQEKHCIVPKQCKMLHRGYDACIRIYRKVAAIEGVKHVFIGSGLRYDLMVDDKAAPYLRQICSHQISGQLKIAPEHRDDRVLGLMNKPRFAVYEEFVRRFKAMSKSVGKDIYVVNYFITSHPGASLAETLKLALYLVKRRIRPEQIQDFLPTPTTRSTCMYHTGMDPLTGRKLHVSKSADERGLQRALIQYDRPQNHSLVVRALKKLQRMDVLPQFEWASRKDKSAPGPQRTKKTRTSGRRIGKKKHRRG